MPALHISKPQKRKVQGEVSDYWYVRVTKTDGKRTWRTTACGSRKPRPHGRATTYGGDLPPLLQVESVPFESPERGAENAHGTVESACGGATSIPREPIGARA